MTNKFKVGDKVVYVNNIGLIHKKCLIEGEIYTIANSWPGSVQLKESSATWFDYRFELVKCNGVDAKGNPMCFTDDMLKDWMIVKIKRGDVGVIKTGHKSHGNTILYLSERGFDKARFADKEFPHINIIEIYDVGDANGFILKPEYSTDEEYLVWKAVQPVVETEQQKAIRELEESIKTSTEKLQALKGTL